MSDFLFSTTRRAPGELKGILQKYLAPVTAAGMEYHGEWGSLAVASAPHDSQVVEEDQHFISVMVGNPVVRTGPGFAGRAQTPRYRRAVHELLRPGEATGWDQHLDGPFAAIGIDKNRSAGIVVTDINAFVTVFFTPRSGVLGTVVGTHVDCVAAAAGRNRDLDLVSAADLVMNLTATFPYTLYNGVKQVAPASVWDFGPNRIGGAPVAYWRPMEQCGYSTMDEAALALRKVLTEDLHVACDGLPLVGLLLSGGEDARAVLGACPDGARVRAFTFADWNNREVRIARRVAEAYGAEFVFGQRAPDHYLNAFEDVAALLGSSSLFIDVHGYGFHRSLGIEDLPAVLGGLSSDSFLKAKPARAGRGADPRLPQRAAVVREDLLDEVAKRRSAFGRWLAEMRPDAAREWDRIWPASLRQDDGNLPRQWGRHWLGEPFSMREHGANFHGNRRMFATHEPFHSNGVVKIAAAVPLRWKDHRALFHRAMRPFLRRSWYIPHGKFRYPYFGRYANLPLAVGLGVTRSVRAVVRGEVRVRQGPWPKWARVVASEGMRRRREGSPLLESPLRSILVAGSEVEAERTILRDWHPLRQLFVLQLSYLARLAER